MNYKYKRIISLFCAMLVFCAFLIYKPMTVRAVLTESAIIAIMWAVSSMVASVGFGMATDDTFRGQVYSAFQGMHDDLQDIIDKIGTGEINNNLDGMCGFEYDENGNIIAVNLSGEAIAEASKILGTNIPNEATEITNVDNFPQYLSDANSYFTCNRIVVDPKHEDQIFTISGGMYEFKVNLFNSYNQVYEESKVKKGVLFVYCPHGLECKGIYGGSLNINYAILVESGSAAYNYVRSKEYKVERERCDVSGMDGYISALYESYGWGDYSDIKRVIRRSDTNSIEILMRFNTGGGSNHYLNDKFDPDRCDVGEARWGMAEWFGYESEYSTDLTQLKNMYANLATEMQKLMDANEELKQMVISVPVGDDSIGNDLPGFLAALKALEANQTDAAKDLISTLEKILAKSAEESAVIGGTLTGITEKIDTIEKDITETKDIITTIKEILTGEKANKDLPKYQFDLRKFFPFCIPFDLIDFVGVLDASPQAPVLKWPVKFSIGSFSVNEEIEVDFSTYNSVAEIMRTMELLLFVVGLILMTRNLIRG